MLKECVFFFIPSATVHHLLIVCETRASTQHLDRSQRAGKTHQCKPSLTWTEGTEENILLSLFRASISKHSLHKCIQLTHQHSLDVLKVTTATRGLTYVVLILHSELQNARWQYCALLAQKYKWLKYLCLHSLKRHITSCSGYCIGTGCVR